MANQPINPPMPPGMKLPPGAKPVAPPSVPSEPGKPGGPPMVGKQVLMKPPPGAQPQPGQAPPGDPEEEDDGQEPTFWQQPWVQNLLPFITSLTVHAGILVIGLMAAFVYAKATEKEPDQIQEVIPTAELSDTPGGVPNVGTGGDVTKEARQNIDEKVNTKGFSQKAGPSMQVTDSGGGSGDNSSGNIQPGPGDAFGKGGGLGRGSGDGTGGGGDGGPAAPFGVPGGGGQGIKGPMFGNGGNARKITFVCDSSGSMINKMPILKEQLSKTVLKLKPSQAFEVIFFKNEQCEAFSKQVHQDGGLVPATPAAKRSFAGRDGFLEGITAAGTTDPIPGLEMAFRSKPELIYILTDGDFPDNDAVLKKIAELKKGAPRVKINTIAFTGDGDNDTAFLKLLEQIAKDSGGVFRHVKESDIENGSDAK